MEFTVIILLVHEYQEIYIEQTRQNLLKKIKEIRQRLSFIKKLSNLFTIL